MPCPLPPCGVGPVVVLVGPTPPVWGSVFYRDMVGCCRLWRGPGAGGGGVGGGGPGTREHVCQLFRVWNQCRI